MMHIVSIFLAIIKYRFFALIEYPGAYLAGIIAQWLVYGAEMLMIFLIVDNFGVLAGWQPPEVIFLYAVFLLSYALGATFTFNVSMSFPQMAIGGTLDEAYIRPMPPFLYLLATHINLGYISHIVLTLIALCVSIAQLNPVWSFLHWLWLIVLIVAGAILQGCMMLLYEMPAIRTRTKSPSAMLYWEGRSFCRYPVSIYPKPLQFIFASVLPFGFVSFYPIQVLLGKEDGFIANVAMWLTPVVALLFVGITAIAWNVASRTYESAGT